MLLVDSQDFEEDVEGIWENNTCQGSGSVLVSPVLLRAAASDIPATVDGAEEQRKHFENKRVVPKKSFTFRKRDAPFATPVVSFCDLFRPLSVPMRTLDEATLFLNDTPSASRRRKHADGALQQRKRLRVGNDFVLNEAEVEGDASSDELEDSDVFNDSFVAVEESPPLVTESQQVRYLESTKDTPKRFGMRKSLDEIVMETLQRPDAPDQYLAPYELDEDEAEFCVPNDYVEYEALGDFTQRMDEARVALQLESPSARFKKNLRSHTRRKHEQAGQSEFKVPMATTKRHRKRILVLSSSSDSD